MQFSHKSSHLIFVVILFTFHWKYFIGVLARNGNLFVRKCDPGHTFAVTSTWPPPCWVCVEPQCNLNYISCLQCWNLAYPAHRIPGCRYQCLGHIWSPDQCVPGSPNQSFQYLRSYFVIRTLSPLNLSTRVLQPCPHKVCSGRQFFPLIFHVFFILAFCSFSGWVIFFFPFVFFFKGFWLAFLVNIFKEKCWT